MNRLLYWLLKPWLMALLGVLLLALLVWYEAPLLAFNGSAPLATAAARWKVILLLLLIWAAYFGARLWLARRANRGLMEGVASAPLAPGVAEAAAEVADLGSRMRAAMAVLRKANPGWKMSGQYLYQLPWYLFVGAPGSGKTTALTQSGLQFPLSDALGPEAIGGVGGTRHCDWWFTDEAVLLDTAGRYTTQDSYTEVDKAAWGGFLALLKKYRRQRPINGAIVALSVADLLQQGEAGRQAQAQAIRARIDELHERLGLRFPVYVVVTKCDLLAGFAEFFEPLGREERAQVWGVTFPLAPPVTADGPGQPMAALAGFPAEFDALERQLQVRVLARMQQERDLQRRALLYSFPQQFAGIGAVLTRFLETVFEANRYQQPALLRGVYFTSGTQQGSPIDRVMASLAASFGLGRKVLPPGVASGRSYFITRLMRDVIFPEAGLAGVNRRELRRHRLLSLAAMAGAGLLLLALALGLTISYGRNQHFVTSAAAATTALEQQARSLPADGGVLGALPLLNAARALPAGYGARDQRVPVLNRFSLYQGDKLGDGAEALYRRLLRETLLPRITSAMEDALRRGDANSQDFLYETLRAYLMLGQPQHFDAASVQAWADVEWRRQLPQATELQRQQLSDHVGALFAADDEAAEPVVLDAALIAQTRLALASMPLPLRIYNRLRRQVSQARLPESTINGALGHDGSALFARTSGAPLSRGVPGLYSVAGAHMLADRSGAAVADVAKDGWVLERQETAPAAGAAATRDAVLQLYYADYIRQWDAFLGDIRLVPLTSLDQAARVANALAAGDAPLRVLLQAAARATTLDVAAAPASAVDQLVRSKLDQAKRQLESALGSDDGPATAPPAPAGNPVDGHFAALHAQAAGAAGAPIEQALALMKDVALYFDAAEAARRNGTPAPSGEVLLRLKRAADGQPAPLSTLLNNVNTGAAGLALGSERARLNALWSAAGAPFCRDAIGGRYPLVRSAARDITADDFGKFFGPGGLMDDFFSKNLAPAVDMSGGQWHWRGGGATPLGIPQDVLDQFQRGARLRDMFFASDAHQPSLHFTLRPLSADTALSKVTLELDGQPVLYVAGAAGVATPIALPSGKGDGVVRLTATPALRAELHTDGPWAWLHLMDQGQLEADPQGGRYRLTLTLDGSKILYELSASSVINPYRRDALEQFHCPASL